MPDMLVKLYDLPALQTVLTDGISIRAALAPEKRLVVEWVRRLFGNGWASETEVSFSRTPVSCFIAVKGQEIRGFACYDAIKPNFFGPTGVDEQQRGKGIGRALLLATLHAQAAQGYAYSIIGGVGPAEFYRKTVAAIMIEGSDPGVYRDMLLDSPDNH